jgi:hypothetical protein
MNWITAHLATIYIGVALLIVVASIVAAAWDAETSNDTDSISFIGLGAFAALLWPLILVVGAGVLLALAIWGGLRACIRKMIRMQQIPPYTVEKLEPFTFDYLTLPEPKLSGMELDRHLTDEYMKAKGWK